MSYMQQTLNNITWMTMWKIMGDSSLTESQKEKKLCDLGLKYSVCKQMILNQQRQQQQQMGMYYCPGFYPGYYCGPMGFPYK